MSTDWNPPGPLIERARMHAALGDPHRLAIAQELTLGDRSPAWFGQRWQWASNLVAHHVQSLVDAGLVMRAPSRADRRRVFLRLTAQGRGLVEVQGVAAGRILFVCTGNSARSQFAEALWRRRSSIPAGSCGTAPAARVDPSAVRAAGRRGIDLSQAVPKDVQQQEWGGALVVTVCDSADRWTVPPHLHWSVADPVAVGTDEAFDRAWDDIAERVEVLVRATGEERP